VAVSPRYCGMEAQYVAPPPARVYDAALHACTQL